MLSIRCKCLQMISYRFLHISRNCMVNRAAIPQLIHKRKNAYLQEKNKALTDPDYFDVASMFTLEDLFYAKAHYGHKEGSLEDSFKPYVYGKRFNHIIIDLNQTVIHLRKALNFVAHIAFQNGVILFMMRTPRYQEMVENAAVECKEYSHCHPYNYQMLTNSKLFFGFTTRLPDLIIFLSILENSFMKHRAVADAARMHIPTVGIVDSNTNDTLITYPIPGNDDSNKAISLYCDLFKKAILKGKKRRCELLEESFSDS